MSMRTSRTSRAIRICRATSSEAPSETQMSEAPSEIRLHRRSRELALAYRDGAVLKIPCELLRVFSPSAEVRGHSAEERKLVTGKKYVNIDSIERVGNYAVKI